VSEQQDIIREFLIESNENLNRLDQDMVQLEQQPGDKELLASVFRTIHTIKGTCGFLGFKVLERVTHHAESLLSQLRSGERQLSNRLVELILETVDAARKILVAIEATEAEGMEEYPDLVRRLESACAETAPAAVAPEDPRRDAAAEAPAPPDPSKPEVEKTSAAADSAIRVDVGLLDKLMNLVGELVLARNQVLQFNTQKEDGALNATSQRLNLITSELQANVMKTRMQPIGVVWNKLPRLVRDTAHSCGKQVRLELDGSDTELDKTIIEAIKDPLTHLVRNCCDHGVERPEERVRRGKPAEGVVSLRAYHEGGQVNIEISDDDGAGIDVECMKQKAIEKNMCSAEQAGRMTDREALNLIFLAGFTTAQNVTNVSGRGVGMDVVKSNIEKIGGLVDVVSRVGAGTTVKLKIPLTLAIIPGLVVTSSTERFIIPQVSLLELIRLDGGSSGKIEYVHGTPVYRRRGTLLPIAYLNTVLGLKPPAACEAVNIVVLQAEDRQFGLVVDGINDTQEIVVKPLGKQLKGLTIYAGATIMGDGRVALILDALCIGQRSGVLAERRDEEHAESQKKTQSAADEQRLLLFRAGSFERLAVPLSLVSRLEEFPQSVIERAGGSRVVQYRGSLLALLSLASVLDPDVPDQAIGRDPAQVIVFQDGERSLGIVVDQILDIVEDVVTIRRQSARKGLLGSAVVGKRVADVLDLQAVLGAAAGDWFHQASGRKLGKTVLLAEPAAFVRGLLRSELQMAGFQVVEAADTEQAVSQLEHGAIDMVLVAVDLPPEGSRGLLDAVRRRPGSIRIPVLALASGPVQAEDRPAGAEDFDDYQSKFDRDAMLRSIERLAAALEPEHAVLARTGKER
jgi:two-component system chemotaxis sensor kinase CheA